MGENRLASDLDHVLDHTRDLWNELDGGRIFITGGTGFFGCWLLESFVWAVDRLGLHASALVLTRDADAFRRKAPHLAVHPAIGFHPGDVRSFDFPAGSFSHVIHAATESSARLNSEHPLTMFDTIVEGTRHTLEFAGQAGTRRFLFTSSGAVYGKQPPELTHIPEDYPGAPDPTDPGSAYGEGKRAGEILCTLHARQGGFEAAIARCFAFVGPYLPLDTHFAIGNFIRDGMNGGPIVVNGDGTPLRSYLYAADLAIWLWTILFTGQSSLPINVGSSRSISIAELAELIRCTLAPGSQIQILKKGDKSKPIQQYVPSVKYAKQTLGLEEWITLETAITRTNDWHNSKIRS